MTATIYRTRVWDLPTRIFHWALLACVVGMVITGNLGGALMPWHFRIGYMVMALLLFRMVWGVVGGRWSRFGSFLFAPGTVVAYLRGQAKPEHSVGHNPLGAGSVLALLVFLLLQVASGLVSDDEISNSGPLSRFVANARVALATSYHKNIGKWILLALIALHVAAIVFYLVKKKENLIGPMLGGDKLLPVVVKPSRDDAASRAVAAVVFALCLAFAAWVGSFAA